MIFVEIPHGCVGHRLVIVVVDVFASTHDSRVRSHPTDTLELHAAKNGVINCRDCLIARFTIATLSAARSRSIRRRPGLLVGFFEAQGDQPFVQVLNLSRP